MSNTLQAVTPSQAASGDEELGRRVRERREALHLSQGGLGSLMRPQRSQGWVSNVETGARNAVGGGLRELARVLDTTVAWLLGEPPVPGPERAEEWASLSPARRESIYRMIGHYLAEEVRRSEEEPPA